ncbi:MAG: M6 family metalloprotease domain-containing protein [bacterium]|nr:M6 family metalloprotease domain-containing protein [bacterium]
MKIFKLVVFVWLGLMFVPLKAVAVTYDADLLIISQNQPPIFQPSAFSFQPSGFCAMPPHPDLKERLKREGKWERFRRESPKRPAGLDTAAPTKAPIIGIRKAIVLLVDFSDKVADTTQFHYQNLLFSLGTYPTGSMRDYYQEVSYSQLDVQGSVTGWYRAPKPYSYYTNGNYGFGTYPWNAQRLTEDTVNLANPYVNFANYDNDGDRYVDALFIVHAGQGAEVTGNRGDIWSHKWETKNPMVVDNVYVHSYSMEPKDGKIGVFAHELGHVFGLPDLYDTGEDSEGIGKWSLMSSGSWLGNPPGSSPAHPDAWCKIQLGWVSLTTVTTNMKNAQIPQVETSPTIYKLWKNGQTGKEYFLVENRQKVGFDSYLPGSGLLIYHVDEDIKDYYSDSNEWNKHQWYPPLNPANHNHYLVAVEQADGHWHLEHNTNRGDTGDPYPGSSNNRVFNDFSTPNSNAYNGESTIVGVVDISNSGTTMTATLQISSLLGTFSLISPPDGSETKTLTPTFKWGTTTAYDGGTVTYIIWYGTDSSFNTNATKTLIGNTFSSTLVDNSTYYWKVQAVDKYNTWRWSNETNWEFYVNLFNEPPGTPTLKWPENGGITSDLTPTFKWDGVFDPDPNDTVKYELWYGKNSPDENKIKDITTTHYTLSSPLDNNSTYYWQVWAKDIAGSRTCSGTFTLTTSEIIVYPNPFYTKDTQITFAHLRDNSIIKIFTIAGEFITTLSGNNETGKATWQPKGIASGIYLYVIESNGEIIDKGKLGIIK